MAFFKKTRGRKPLAEGSIWAHCTWRPGGIFLHASIKREDGTYLTLSMSQAEAERLVRDWRANMRDHCKTAPTFGSDDM